MDAVNLLSQADFARALPMLMPKRFKEAPSRQYIYKLVKSKRIPLKNGMVPVLEAISAMEKSSDPSKGFRKVVASEQLDLEQRMMAPVMAAPAEGEDENAASPSFSSFRTEREGVQLQLQRLQLMREQGAVVEKEEVVNTTRGVFRALRDALLNIPAQAASKLAPLTDERLIRQALEEEIRRVLHETAKTIG